MTPWFTATEKFTPEDGQRWRKYIEWSHLAQLTEVVSLDPMLCPPILTEIKNEYWPHIVNEDYMLNYFVDLEFLSGQVTTVPRKNLLCVIRNPSKELVEPPVGCAKFVGYDLVDLENSASALTNCGGFPIVFDNAELSQFGLLTAFERAAEVRAALRSQYPKEHHANCHLWAIYRICD